MERQYFQHPRNHLFQRNGGNAGSNAGAPSSTTGDLQASEDMNLSNDMKKDAPKKNVSSLMLLGIMYTYTMSGAYAIEETVMGGGPLLTIISIILIPVFMAMPTAVVVSELATAIPSNAAFLMWISVSFHRVVYFAMVLMTILFTFIDNALFPVLVSEYVCTSIKCSTVINRSLRAGVLVVSYILNLVGLQSVGVTSIFLSIITVLPFVIMFTMSFIKSGFYLNWPAIAFIPDKIDWPTFVSTASWNLCGLEQAASVSEEMKAPHRTIIRGLLPLLGLAYLTYIPPILTGASTRTGPPDISEWTTGYWSYVAETVGGTPLQMFLIVASGFSVLGMMVSALCTTTHTLAGVAYTGVFPTPVSRILYQRNKRFGTYHWTLTINALVAGVFSVLFDFGPLVQADQVLYGLRIVLIFVSFLIIRYRYPNLHRPYRVPLAGYKLGLLAIPIALFSALTVVAMIEDTQTIIINVVVIGSAFVLSFIYCFLIRKEEFFGRVITGVDPELIEEEPEDVGR